MSDHQQNLIEPKLEHQPPHAWYWASAASVRRLRTTAIAVFAAAAILVYLLMRFGVRTSADASQIPLLAALVLGGIPLL